MITVYKKGMIPKNMELVSLNDIYFNKYTAEKLDERAVKIIAEIDQTQMLDRFTILSRFDEVQLNIDRLSTGCKITLNILYNTDKVFDIRECGDNALDVIYSLPEGNVYCDYPLISYEIDRVNVKDKNGLHEIDSYEELKKWWQNED